MNFSSLVTKYKSLVTKFENRPSRVRPSTRSVAVEEVAVLVSGKDA
jgi:hypothetical protein